MIIGAMNLSATLLAMSVIDKLGRKTLLLIGSVGTALCLAGVAAVFCTNSHQSDLVWLLVGFIFFFAISQGAVIWVYISEVFPTRVQVEGAEPGQFLALDHERDYHQGVSVDRGGVGRSTLYLLFRDDGAAVLRGACLSTRKRRGSAWSRCSGNWESIRSRIGDWRRGRRVPTLGCAKDGHSRLVEKPDIAATLYCGRA